MVRDYISLSCVPYEEDCAQLGSPDYTKRAIIELNVYRNQIIRQLGYPPEGAELKIKACPHDFGTYHELYVYYDTNDEKAVKYAFMLDEKVPAEWDTQAREELKKAGYLK